jgi:predicted ATPase/class 3 adenylate cyclase
MGMRPTSARAPAAGLPTGTLTFVFSDIEGSTVRWDRDRTAMQDAVLRHDAIVRGAIESRGGYVFKTIGDAFCAAFPTAPAALAAAIDAQRALAAEDFSSVDGIRVRMALHTGDADERNGDYFGPALNRVARLLAIGYGGQILVSQVTVDIVRSSLPEGFEFRDLGEHQLKNISHLEHVSQLVGPGLTPEFPPLRSIPIDRNNLPTQISSLIGRSRSVDELCALVRRSRLVTITGAGGIGKTRVALDVAADLLDNFEDGVWFVDLAALRSPELVASQIASALALPLVSERPALEVVVAHLNRRNVLLVVDNCEHLIEEASRVVETILRECVQVRVLATSREFLGIEGEHAFRLPSLEFPPAGADVNADSARDFSAIALFAERAASANPEFSLTDKNATIVGDVCRRLSGIALAIELAAARVNVLGVGEIRDRLNERFRFFTEGRRNALPRQQTMRATIDWSFDLLSELEQTLFRRLSIFAGGWTLEAAEAVCAFDGLDKTDVLNSLASLARKSLVVVSSDESTTRYDFLESTRAYALEKAQQELGVLSQRHAAWVTEFVEANVNRGWTISQNAWLMRIERELDNIRLALEYALGGDDPALIAARIAERLASFWYDAGLQAEGRRWLDAALSRIDEDAQLSLAGRLWRAVASNSTGRRAVEAGQKAVDLLTRAGDRAGLPAAYAALAFGLWEVGNLPEAESASERTLELCKAEGLDGSRIYSDTLATLANVERALGRHDEARKLFDEALSISIKLEDERTAASVGGNLAELEFASGNVNRAVVLASSAAQTFRKLQATAREATALVNLATYRITLGELESARESALAALTLAKRVEDTPAVSVALQNLAAVRALKDDVKGAALLLGYVDEWYRSVGYERDWSERKIREIISDAVSKNLPEDELMKALKGGGALSEDDAIALALTE